MTDFGFSPFNDCLLATGGEDGVVSVIKRERDTHRHTQTQGEMNYSKRFPF